jgi:hypothetical protein
MLISKDVSLIKDTEKELYKNRKLVKRLKYKLDEYVEKYLSVQTNNSSYSSSSSSSSSSTFLLLNPEEFPQNLDEKDL